MLHDSDSPDDSVALESAAEIERIARAGVRHAYNGEVQIWSEDGYLTRISLHERQIAWVSCNLRQEDLGDRLTNRANVTRWSLRRAMEYASRTKCKLSEALIALRVIPLPRLRGILHEHLQSHLWAALQTTDSLRARFVPLDHKYGLDLTFAIDEFAWDLAGAGTVAPPMPAPVPDELSTLCQRAAAGIESGLLVGVIDLDGGRVLASGGTDQVEARQLNEALERLRIDVVSRLQAVSGSAGEASRPIEEIGLLFGGVRCVARTDTRSDRCYVLFTTAECSAGAASAHLRHAAVGFERARSKSS